MSSLFLQSAFNLIDTFWVGRLGPASLAAVSVSAFLIWAMFSLAEALSLGVNSLMARRIGAGEEEAGAGLMLPPDPAHPGAAGLLRSTPA